MSRGHFVTDHKSRRSGLVCDLLDPLTPPGRRIEVIGEVLCLTHNFAAPKLHDAHRTGWLTEIVDGVFGDPEIFSSQNSPDLEARRLARVMTTQCLQVVSPKDRSPDCG
jgi:hypothetical protein